MFVQHNNGSRRGIRTIAGFAARTGRYDEIAHENLRRSKAFTLIELLVVVCILAVVTGSIAACLAGGIRIWETARNFDAVTANAMVGLRIMEKDLVNAFRFHGIDFNGKEKEVSFPGLVMTRTPDEQNLDVQRIGTVRYFFNREGKNLTREDRPYPGGTSGGRSEKIVLNLRDLNLAYYHLPEKGKPVRGGYIKAPESGGVWQDFATNFPDIVRIELFLETGADVVKIERTVILPIRKQK